MAPIPRLPFKDSTWKQNFFIKKQEVIGLHVSESEVAQSCLILCDPMDCSLPGSSVHGILQARILESVAFPSPGDLPDPGITPRSPAAEAEPVLTGPPGKPLLNKCMIY